MGRDPGSELRVGQRPPASACHTHQVTFIHSLLIMKILSGTDQLGRTEQAPAFFLQKNQRQGKGQLTLWMAVRKRNCDCEAHSRLLDKHTHHCCRCVFQGLRFQAGVTPRPETAPHHLFGCDSHHCYQRPLREGPDEVSHV